MPLKTAFNKMGGESGLEHRSTACARGATLMEGLTSPLRILEPMKRVGKRGEGKWERISFEQLIKEVVEGAIYLVKGMLMAYGRSVTLKRLSIHHNLN